MASPLIRVHRMSAAQWPMLRAGWLTTVSGGAQTAAQGWSSKQARAISSGQRSCRSRSASRAPSESRLLLTNSAAGRSAAVSSCRVAARPASMLSSLVATHASGSGMIGFGQRLPEALQPLAHARQPLKAGDDADPAVAAVDQEACALVGAADVIGPDIGALETLQSGGRRRRWGSGAPRPWPGPTTSGWWRRR